MLLCLSDASALAGGGTPLWLGVGRSSSSRGAPLQSLQTKYVFLKSVVLRIIEWRDAIICLRSFVYIYIDSIQI